MGLAGRAICLILAIIFLIAEILLEAYIFYVAMGVIGFWSVAAIIVAVIVLGALFKIALEGADD